ncbi:hypothetical protein [Ruminococcus sp.]|uniref:hypothetical protein n=1 Tax=Ruminococcus sp. TaxID=41978 RepID=UPI0025D3327A|nr:hypothetical protein [Ruminococcus sp.]MBQ6252728.1 hypothetical protein [Ruminococcus sp.]MBR0511766.1 hypothetical protein [Ruminococcus sp.]MBR6995824.1 hypothetical protein [Ruminococcus sp.]
MDTDIDLYIDFIYHGFYKLADIEERFDEYQAMAAEAAKDIGDDEVILFAIYAFDEDTQRFIYANFMLKRLTLEHYARVCERLSKFCRLFCIGNG